MNQLIRVAQVMGHMSGGGVESSIMNYYRHIDRDSIQFDFIVDADSTIVPREEIEDLGGRVYVVPPYKHVRAYASEMRALLARLGPDIVHSNINTLSVFPLRAAKKAGITVRIAHNHSTSKSTEHLKSFAKNVLRPFSRVYPTELAACSEYCGRWLFGGKAVDEHRVTIIPNAIETSAFVPSTTTRRLQRASLGLEEDQFVLGQVGRMDRTKNQPFTLSLFKQFLTVQPKAVLLFAGDGKTSQSLRLQAQQLGIMDSVKFLGFCSNVSDLYQALDVLMLPSLNEGFSVTAVEAQVSGLPILASTGVPEETCLVPGLMQFLPLDKPDTWVTALTRLDPKNRRGRRSEIMAAGYDINESAKRLGGWYRSLANC